MYSVSKRFTSTSRVALNAARQQQLRSLATEVPKTTPVAPKKKTHRFRKFLFKVGLLTITFYGAGAYISTKNDTIQDLFVENVPYGENALDALEYYLRNQDSFTINNAQNKVNDSINSLKGKLGLDSTVSIPKSGVTSEKFEASKPVVVAAPTTPVKKSSPIETVKSTAQSVKEQIAVALPTLTTTGDSSVDKVVDALNEYISSASKKLSSADTEKLKATVTENFKSLAEKYKLLSSSKKEAFEVLIKEKEEEISKQYNDKKIELTTDFLDKLTSAKLQLEQKFSSQLAKEVETTTVKIMKEAENIIEQTKLNVIDEFSKVVTERIENESNGKLKGLEALAARVDQIEKIEQELFQNANGYISYKKIEKSIANLNKLLESNITSENAGEELVKRIDELKTLVAPLNNEVINSALDALPSNSTLYQTGGILTQSQLISRWELLSPKLRSVSLLPPNAGLLGHFSSLVFSKLLMSKQGAPIKQAEDDQLIGNDVESVIARVHNYLLRNELDNAVEEVSSLKGSARSLASDWVAEGRKKLEVQFLVDVISTEAKVIA
ncbi:hypothetical protein B5S28_g771 [[Candida] boidinii]|uniref:Unnamed protein product n=1 Tax=Candida boidinii TaxID=5477 RepID=A0ACB5TG32_CANBO|nr:hypothetical protein B5S28_g771 [[Candida] boidinii]OWB60710.1 hypothetical protein B5S29_g1590 [[Candida] boidinii]OWB72182.1 hypothetical protein B5S31_g1888 [[Candida] boidinii]OWB77826.1 hypothetical protein B5S32_g2004 [[Candida] boidinii]GME87978.1 unnamed protein product [[Candida] boidinii]